MVNRSGQIFLASVCYENNRQWEIRSTLAQKLIECGYRPWRWEVEGMCTQQRSYKDWVEVVSHAIKESDAVVAFYKSSAGTMPLVHKRLLHFPTDREMSLAIEHRKPLFLYFINSRQADADLKAVSALFANRIMLGRKPRYCPTESNLITRVLEDLGNATKVKTSVPQRFTHPLFNPDDSVAWFEMVDSILNAYISSGDYIGAFDQISLLVGLQNYIPTCSRELVPLGNCFAKAAHVYAIRAMFSQAFKLALSSIRLFIEADEQGRVLKQVHALAGMQNMAGVKSAKWVNRYGEKVVYRYLRFNDTYRDSKISILRDNGCYEKALELAEYNWEETAYSSAKYAHLLGLSSIRDSVDKARAILDGGVLIRALNEPQSLPYVLRIAGELAIRDGDILSARSYLADGIVACEDQGTLHMKARIMRLQQEISQVS